MPKQIQVYTDRFDEVLELLVERVGEQNWTEITRQMKNLYGMNIPQKPMVQARWRALDPKINREPFTQDELVQHWHFCVRQKCHWDAVRDQYEGLGQQRDKTYLAQKFSQLFTQKLSELNRILGRTVSFNQQKIDFMRDATKKRVIEFNGRDPLSLNDQSAREILMSCKYLVQVMTKLIDCSHMETEEMWEEVKKIISPIKFQKILYNIFIMDTILQISCNALKAVDDNTDIINADDMRRGKFIKPTKIRYWEEAQEQPSSPEHSEDDDILTAVIKLSRMGPQTQFTKKDIEEIKESFIYKYCNTDQNRTFYNWYNEAKILDNAFQSNLTVDIMEMEGGRALLNYDPEQPKRVYRKRQKPETKVTKQIKKFHRKRNKILREGQRRQKIKTKKGRIRLYKEKFPGMETIQFNKDLEQAVQDEQSSQNYQLMDADQIYKMNLRMNNKEVQSEQRSEESESYKSDN